MPATVTEKFHVHNADQFIESLSETANDTYYLFIGRPVPWSGGDGSPSTPNDAAANTMFDYWKDMIAVQRITSSDLSPVIPRYTWTENAKYNMYDHRIPQTTAIANTSYPFYVVTSNFDVFKCLYNGRTNAASGAANSTVEPTISGQADVTALTTAAGDPANYVWKYLYTITTADALKYVTTTYVPVQSVDYTLNANGDVNDDGTNKYDVFDAARTSGNGAIYRVVVEAPGSGYTNPPTVTISGDGSSAAATATVGSGQVTGINVTANGTGYTTATVTITANGDGGTGATATAIITPRHVFSNNTGTYYVSNHGINLKEELGAKYVMLYAELAGSDDGGLIPTGNDYRRIGILRNPLLYGTNTRASVNVLSMTTDLTLTSTTGTITKDEIVWQPSTNAYGVVVEQEGSVLKLVGVVGAFSNTGNTYILGIGNGEAGGQTANATITIPATPEAFTSTVANSGATAYVTDIALPDLQPYSGDILYVDHRAPITRANDQTEVIRTILTF